MGEPSRSIKNRKEFFALLESVNESNRDYFSRFGNWIKPQIKVFWIEVNDRYHLDILKNLNPKKVEKTLYEVHEKDQRYWIDISDKRIWQIFTFAETKSATQMIKNRILNHIGADRIWLTEKFMEKIQKELGYSDRGFGIKYKDILTEDEPKSKFSAKLWVGREKTEAQERLLSAVRDNFSLSSTRFGRNEARDGLKISGQLYELYYSGHITVNTCDDNEDMMEVLNLIKNNYKNEIEYLEKERRKRSSVIEILFSDNIDQAGLESITNTGKGSLKLWLHPFKKEEGITRYNGVDLHTGDYINLDVSNDYSYISTPKNACMNVAPRFGTIASRYLSSKVSIFHDGVELFA